MNGDRPLAVRLQWSAGQFSDSSDHHEHDAEAMLSYASHQGIDVVGGSEAQGTNRNSFLDDLRWFAPRYGFRLFAQSRQDCWIAVDRTFGHGNGVTFDQVAPAVHKPAHLGGHGPRGNFRVTVVPHEQRIAPRIHFGGSHFLTRVADPHQLRNDLLCHELGQWAQSKGAGGDLVFFMGDTNRDDQVVDVFGDAAPLTSCWDELGKWPTTEPTRPGGRGPTLDVIASYDRDRRVSCHSARALDDTDLHLFADHYTIRATYAVKPRGAA